MDFSSIIKIALENSCTVMENEPMSHHTTFKIGGPARLFISIPDIDALKKLVRACKENDVKYFVLGNGSDLLVSDNGMSCAVFSLNGDFKKIELTDDNKIFCGAGVSLSALCSYASSNSLSGLEFAWGIPAGVGGAAYMNAGAYGGELKDVIERVDYVDANGNAGSFSNEECNYGYRHSIFMEKKLIITGISVKLTPDDTAEIKKRMSDYMERRKTKQPLEFPSAGSVFKRPVGYFAGALIEQSGLKGVAIGGAQVSEKHAGFIVNKGGATCKDVCNLIDHIKKKVYDDHGVELECEVKMIGDEN